MDTYGHSKATSFVSQFFHVSDQGTSTNVSAQLSGFWPLRFYPLPLSALSGSHTHKKKIQTYLIFYEKAHSCYICHSLLLVQSGSQKFVFFSVSKIDPQPQGCESITKMVHFWLTYLFQEQANSETFFVLYKKKCV